MILSLFLLISLLATGLWAQLDQMPFWLLAAATSLILFLRWGPEALPKVKLERQGWIDYLIGTGLAAPILISLFFTRNQEFPLSGDHDHHAAAMVEAVKFWNSSSFVLVPVLIIFGVGLRREWLKAPGKKWWPLLLLTVLWTLSFFFAPPHAYFSRYPAAGYFLAWPLGLLGDWFQLNALRVSHALSPLIGLFLLRPLVTTRPLGWAWVWLALLFFWQKDVVYYFTASYLEPWALVFVALGLEQLWTLESKSSAKSKLQIDGEAARSLMWPSLLVGAAAVIKEQAILLLPFVWLASYPKFYRNKEVKVAALVLWASALPFVIYYFYRKSQGVWRGADFVGIEALLSLERWAEVGLRFRQQFDGPAVIIPCLIFIAFVALQLRGQQRRTGALVFLAALVQVLFFFSDKVSADWLGYPRFHLFAFLLLSTASFALANSIQSNKKRVFIAAVLVLLQVPSLWGYASTIFDDDSARNYMEHYDSPHFMPLRSLMAKASGHIDSGSSVFINAPRANFHAFAIAVGYKDLVQNYRLQSHANSFDQPRCRCNSEAPNIFLPKILERNIKVFRPQPSAREKLLQACRLEIEQTCSVIFYHTVGDGEWSGVFGVGIK